MIEYREHITRAMLRAEPDALFVFGDNLQRHGMGGQAAEMRGEPNAVGIPTKKAPRMSPDAFLTDDDWSLWQLAVAADFARLLIHQCNQGKIVWPRAGIGTGMARLQESAPGIHRVVEALRVDLEKHP